MADYLSRSPVDTAEDDIGDRIIYASKSTQTDTLVIPTGNVVNLPKITTVITRAQAKIQKQMVTTSPTSMASTKTDELIPIGKGVNDTPGGNSNRIIPFSMEDLKRCQEEDTVVQEIKKKINNS